METLPAPAHQQQAFHGLPGEVASNQPAFDVWGLLNRRKWIVFLGLLTGLGLGYLYHTQAAPLYESNAMVLIEPKNPISLVDAKNSVYPGMETYTHGHNKIISSASFVEKTFEKNETLTKCQSFAGIPLNENVETVVKALEAEQDREEPNIYHLSFRCGDEIDTRRVLQSVISTYRDTLALSLIHI